MTRTTRGGILAILARYFAAPETKRAVVERLSRTPYAAFRAILGFRGLYPAGIHPIAIHAAAIEANDPRFGDTILAGLKHREILVKLAALAGVVHCSFLYTPEVRQELEALMAVKSIASDTFAMERFREALRAIDGRRRRS